MKKSDTVKRVSGEAGIAKPAAEATVGVVFASIADALARGENVTVTGFGWFARNDRPAREGRNPSTGERIAIGPSRRRQAAQSGRIAGSRPFRHDN